MPAFPSVVEPHHMDGDAAAAATQISVKLFTQLPEPFKVPEDALVTLSIWTSCDSEPATRV